MKMGDRGQHLSMHIKNKNLSKTQELLKEENFDWRVIMLYYSALHLLDSTYSTDETNPHPGNHTKRKMKISEHYNDKICRIYNNLEWLSRQARYDCILMKQKHVDKASRFLQEIENAICI